MGGRVKEGLLEAEEVPGMVQPEGKTDGAR